MRRIDVAVAVAVGLLVSRAPLAAEDAPAQPGSAPSAPSAPAGAGPAAPAQPEKRFREEVEVVAEDAPDETAPAELPIGPTTVLKVAGGADNVFRALQALPGIAATTEFDSRIAVRGGSPDENLTIMDGVEVHNPYRLFGLTSAFNPETVRGFDLYAGAFSAKYGDRLSSLLVVENRPGNEEEGFTGSTALSITDANAVFEGRLPGERSGSWILTARRTYYDLVANSLVDAELPAFGDLQGRLDWTLTPGTKLTVLGLLSRESTDAGFENEDRPTETFDLVTSARNDLFAVKLTSLLGRSVSSRTIAAYYRNADDIGADAFFRNESKRSNAPSDDVGFGNADLAFTRDLSVQDLSLRQELAVSAGAHLVETGAEVHQLRTNTAWVIRGDRNPSAGNGSSIQGGAGLPSDLDSTVDSTRVGAWLIDEWKPAAWLSLEGGLRFDWSGVNRRSTFSPRLSASVTLDRSTRVRAGGGLYTQSPGYEKLIQSDYFVDLSGDYGRSLRYERAAHAVLGLERDLPRGITARVEGYWKGLSDLIVGRLETEPERLARVSRYDFPADLQSSVPAAPIITSFPVNDGEGESWGVDVLVQKRPAPGARLTGWASYTYARAEREEYGRNLPFEYDRRHAATIVGSWRISPKWELGVTARAFSGFPYTPVLGLRVAAQETAGGVYVPALDAEGRYVYETDLGGVSNLSSARLPAFLRLDLRLSWKPRGDAGRWLFYLDVINATNRGNVGQYDAQLEYDPGSALDQPRLVLDPTAAIPFLPSFGVRFRF